MTQHVQDITWQGLPACKLETDALRVLLTPQLGGKLVSLVDKRAGREWLNTAKRSLRLASYGASFVDYDLSGWDEVISTNAACAYPAPGAFAGRALPDHGEVWSVAWTRERLDGDALALSAHGTALPYTLRREIRLEGEASLRFSYQLTNLSADLFIYLWAAHNLHAADDYTEIVLPDSVKYVYNVISNNTWGAVGELYSWPSAVSKDGRAWQLNHIGTPTQADFRRFYIPPDMTINWAALRQLDSGAWLRLEWTANHAPYMAIWIDEGAFSVDSSVGLSPSTGFFDSLTTSHANGRIAELAGHQQHE